MQKAVTKDQDEDQTKSMERKLGMCGAFLYLLGYLLLSKIFAILRSICWVLTGRQAQIDAAQTLYETSAHKMGFYHMFFFDLAYPVSRLNFLLYHDDIVHPEYVLKDEVTLFQITHTEAIFIESKPGMDHPFKSTYSFAIVGQYKTAHRVIVMPLSSLLRLSEEMKDDGATKVMIFNQGRVGSTLMTSIFEHTNRIMAISEPFALNAICLYVFQEKRYSPARGIPIIRAVVRLLCKPYRGLSDPILAYAIKTINMTTAALDLIYEAVPECKPIFLYRDPVDRAQSARRVGEALPTAKLVYYMVEKGFPSGIYHGWSLFGMIGTPYDGYTSQARTGLEVGYFVALATLHAREQARAKGINIPAINFDDLRTNPQDIMSQIFQFCGLPESLVPPAVAAMKRDSQHATDINQDNMRRLMPHPPTPTPLFIQEMTTLARKLSLPEPEKWTKDFRLENSMCLKN